jgi:hypothetical protein
LLTAVEDDRHRAVIHEFHYHHRGELVGFDFNIAGAGEREKMLLEAPRFVRRGGFGKRRPSARKRDQLRRMRETV